jgi:hypothetical protein
MHSHLKRSHKCTTNNHLGSPKAPHHLGDGHHGPRVAPGRHHGPGHAVSDANRVTERRCQRATTRDGPPTAATAIAITCHDNDDNLGGPLCPPPPLSAGLHPGVVQKSTMQVRHSRATRTSSHDRDRARQHTDDLGAHCASHLCLSWATPWHHAEACDAGSVLVCDAGSVLACPQPTMTAITIAITPRRHMPRGWNGATAQSTTNGTTHESATPRR